MVKDIILDDENDYDLIIRNGDFKVSESDAQHQILIINTYLGSWKQYPLQGVGIINYLNSSGQSEALKREIAVKLTSDGYSNISVLVDPNNITDITVNAERR